MDNVIRGHWGDNGGPGNTGGEPPGGDDVGIRVAKLESDVEYIKRDVSELAHAMKVVQGDLSVLKTQSAVLIERTEHVQNHMVTKGQLSTYALIGLFTVAGSALGTAWWIVQQYLAPILAKLPPAL